MHFERHFCQQKKKKCVPTLPKIYRNATPNTLIFYLALNKMLVIRAGIHKIFVRIVNREDPDQTASFEAV